MPNNKQFRCPYCNKSMSREDLVRHIGDKHMDQIPVGYTPMRTAFNWINYGKIEYEGKCTECGGPTKWDEKKGRYDRQCGKKACHDAFVKRFEDNMIKKMGVKRYSDSLEGQEYMLANRKISGKYKFHDGGEKTYTGSYEKEALKFLDQVMECKSNDIITPGPAMQYKYNDELHWYISDIYYVPYNLVIEVKDGGDRPNTRNMPDYRARQIAKEKYIVDNTDYNYLRLTNNDFSQLLSTMADLKMQLVDKTYNRIVNINENMFAAIGGMFPMKQTNNVHIVNYMQNNAFSGEDDIAISDSPKFCSVFYRDADGRVQETDESFLENCTYDVYTTNKTFEEIEEELKSNVGKEVSEGYLYELATGNKMYTTDQIRFDENVDPAIDEYTLCKALQEAVGRYIFDGKPDPSITARLYSEPNKYFNESLDNLSDVFYSGTRNQSSVSKISTVIANKMKEVKKNG